MRIFIFLAATYLFFFNFDQETSWPQWAYISCFAGVVLALSGRKLPKVFYALWAWILISSVVISDWRPATNFPEAQKISLRLLAGQAALPFLLLTFLFALNFKKIRGALGWGLYAGGLFHTAILITDQLLLDRQSSIDTIGLMGNRSIGASFICVWVFFILHFSGRSLPDLVSSISFWIGVFAIAISKSGISYLALIIGISAGLFSAGGKWKRIGSISILSLIGLIGVIKPTKLLDNSRFKAWPLFFDYWSETANPYLGWGAGSFPFYGPKTQIVKNFMVEKQADGSLLGSWFLWAHNDWLQILLEFGIIGAVLSLLVYFKLLRMSYRRPALFAATVAYGVIMVGNYPWHAAPTAVLGLWLIFEILTGDLTNGVET